MNDETGSELDLGQCPALLASHRFSVAAIEDITEAIAATPAITGVPIVTIAAAGSLGRLEATSHSDVDCVVVVDDAGPVDERDLVQAVDDAMAVFLRCGLRVPKADGIYRRPVRISSLLDPASRGSLAESPEVFGARMQLLLDARPLYGAGAFACLRRELVDWYCMPMGSGSAWTHLLNDLTRYLHAYAVWQQFKFSKSNDDGWYLRQAKLRSTRIVTFAGLMCLLGESSRLHEGHASWLMEELDRTPLARLKRVRDRYPDGGFDKFLSGYDALHGLLADTVVRRALIETSPADIFEVPGSYTGVYQRVHELSAALMDDLTDFILARRDDWSSAIFRNWLL